MRALKKLLNNKLSFAGIGGEQMIAEGLQPLFPQSELALFGLFELLPKIPNVLRRLKQTTEEVKRLRPAAVITIDGPDFSFRLAANLKGAGIPLIHYVAPTVWAWREGRAKKIAKLYNHLLALLPFEPPYFEKEGLACTFVGHSAIETGVLEASAKRFREIMPSGRDKKIITILPGSRRSEIERLAPIFGKTLALLQEKLGEFTVVMPTLPSILDFLTPFIRQWPVKPVIILDAQQKYDAFAASQVALAASGTVALELALAGTPHSIAYRIHPLTLLLYRAFIKVKYVNLTNLLLNRLVVPELLQDDCTPKKLAAATVQLWEDEAVRGAQKQAFQEVRAMLKPGEIAPSEKAARVICEVAGVIVD
jgi:lipid-A-disaccharide synthase